MSELIEPLTQFGVAGLMGLLWVWERRFSRTRERQLTEAHERLLQHRSELDVLVQLISQNTQAFTRFDQALSQALDLLEDVQHASHKKSA